MRFQIKTLRFQIESFKIDYNFEQSILNRDNKVDTSTFRASSHGQKWKICPNFLPYGKTLSHKWNKPHQPNGPKSPDSSRNRSFEDKVFLIYVIRSSRVVENPDNCVKPHRPHQWGSPANSKMRFSPENLFRTFFWTLMRKTR